ncbi:MAG: Holliday junction resolvase RuvX [Bacteroidota bacterium]
MTYINKKYLGLDYGSVRIGVSISDELGILARPFMVLKNSKNIKTEIENIILQNQIQKIIIGLPINLQGQKSNKTLEVEKFVNDVICKIGIDYEYWDERFTSLQAKNISLMINTKKKKRQEKGLIDKYAAAILLQTFLDSVKK